MPASLAFMHVPKTAGTSVIAGLEAAMSPVQPLRGIDRYLFGGFDDFDSLHGDPRRQLIMDPAGIPADAPFIVGHLACSSLLDGASDRSLMTILREPVTRLLSHWLYWRAMPGRDLEDWGTWRDVVRKARQPLGTFLSDPEIAAQTDNLMTRALLWPHRLVPNAGFIEPRDDRRLAREAGKRLRRFDFVDVVENEGFPARMADWLQRPFALPRLNQTARMPTLSRPSSLADELTPEVHALLASRSRLDLRLWNSIARRRLRGVDIEALRERTIIDTVARHAAAMSGSGHIAGGSGGAVT